MTAESPSWNGQQLAVYLIAFVLAIGPFFNGMFFEPIRLVGVALACVAYWLWYTGKLETNLSWNGVDWSVLAWFLSYVIASINPVLPRGHLSVLLDMVAFLAVYSVMRGSPRLEQSFARILVASGLVMVAISVARFAGVIWLDHLIVDLVINNRLSGGFQYPNTFAVWLCCLVLLTLREAQTPRLRHLFLLTGGLFAGAFMLTLSRGALIAAPAAYLVVMLLGSRKQRLFCAWAGLLTWVPAFVLGSAAARALQNEQTAVGLVALAACALPPLATSRFAEFTECLWNRKRTWGIAVAGVLLLGALLLAPTVARKALPVLHQVTQNRMTNGYELSDLSIHDRVTFDSDAWRIMSANHFLGAGGRGWTKLYLQIQSYPYFTTEVHNHFFQTGVEAGAVGLLAFTAVLTLCLITSWRSQRQHQGDGSLAVWAGIITYIGIHSAFDFDLSYISLLLLLAVAAGIVSGRNTVAPGAGHQWVPVWHRAIALATTLAFIGATSLYMSNRALLASDAAFARGDIQGTLTALQVAGRTDPLSAEPWVRRAALRAAIGPAATGLADVPALLAKAEALDGYNPVVTLDLATIAIEQKRWTQGFDLAKKADSLMPLDNDLSAEVGSTMWSAVSGALQADKISEARILATRLKDYDVALSRRFELATPYTSYAKKPFGYTGMIHLRIGQGLIVTGDYAAAAGHLREAVQWASEKGEPTQWLFVALSLGGNQPEAEKLRQASPDLFKLFLQSDLYRTTVAAAKAT